MGQVNDALSGKGSVFLNFKAALSFSVTCKFCF